MSAGLWLSRALPEDVPRLAALESDCYTQPWTLRQFEEEVGYGPPGAVLVLKSPRPSESWGHVRAYCAYRIAVGEMEVLNVAVRESNREALALYRGLGFRTLSRRPGYYRRPAEDAIVLALDPLPPAEP